MSAEVPAYLEPRVTEHRVRSQHVDQTYRIWVRTPMQRADGSERFPVVYATDGDLFFGGYAGLAHTLQLLGEVPCFVLVGIGYEDARAAELLRTRDFYTHEIRALYAPGIRQLATSALIGGTHAIETVLNTTDATHFLEFLRQELMPLIGREYPARAGDNTYVGYSAGGAFGLSTLFSHGDTFRRYLLGSPATSHSGHNFAIELAERFRQSGRALNAHVFMSVGDLEEFKPGFTQFDLVTGLYLFAKHVRLHPIPGLTLHTRVFPDETHATAWTLAFSHGLKALFEPVGSLEFWPDYLKGG